MPKKKRGSTLSEAADGATWGHVAPTLPRIDGASSPQSAGSGKDDRYSFRGSIDKDQFPDDRRVSWEDGGFAKASAGEWRASQSEPSTAMPLDMSHDDVRDMSQMFDISLHMASGHSAAPQTVHAGDNWDIQSPDEIIQDVTQYVHARKPWRQRLDDSFLEHKHNERLDRMERGFHIILPDNRVRLMEDELSYRVRCSLLDMDPEDVEPPRPQPRRVEKSKPKKQRPENPWYLKPHRWFLPKDQLNAENTEKPNDFPYANAILNVPSQPKPELTTFQKENIGIVEPYKAWMKDGHSIASGGNGSGTSFRLPHFLL